MVRIYLTPVCLLAHIGGSMSARGLWQGLKKPGNPARALTQLGPELRADQSGAPAMRVIGPVIIEVDVGSAALLLAERISAGRPLT